MDWFFGMKDKWVKFGRLKYTDDDGNENTAWNVSCDTLDRIENGTERARLGGFKLSTPERIPNHMVNYIQQEVLKNGHQSAFLFA